MDLSNAELEQMKLIFKMFDRDGDGRLTMYDLRAALDAFGLNVSDQVVGDMLFELDKGQKGFADYGDFLHHASTANQGGMINDEDDIKMSFDIFNRSRSGEITRDELKNKMNELGENVNDEEIDDLIKEADIDLNKRINYLEYCRVLRS